MLNQKVTLENKIWFWFGRKIKCMPQLFLKNAITPIKVYTNVWKSTWKNPTSWAPLTHQKKYFVSLILFTVTRTFLLPWWTILLVIQILVTTGPNWTLRLYWQKQIRKLHPYSGKYTYLVIQAFFRLQVIKVLWRLHFLEYLRTLSLKFQEARPCWLSQFSWDRQLGRLKTNSILVRAFWNFKCKILKYSRTCSLHNTLIPNLVKPLIFMHKI